MTITARGKGFEAYVAVNGQRKRKILPTREEAERWEAQTRLAILEGREISVAVQSKNWTLQTAIDRTYEAVWKDSKSASTSLKNARMCIDFFGRNVYVSEITTQRVADFIDHLKKTNNANATINRKLSALSRALRYAMQCEALDKMPYIPRMKEAVGRLRFVTKDEEVSILTLLTQWSDQDTLDAVSVLLDTGLRCGELLKLEGKDFRNDQITIWDTKNGKEHTLPLTSRASRIVSERIAQHGRGLLFPMPYTRLQERFERVIDHLGIEDVTLHTLRHTYASRLVQRGVSIQTVSKLLNHSTIQITMRYAHLAPSNLVEAVKVLED